jgi:hypothetical protein
VHLHDLTDLQHHLNWASRERLRLIIISEVALLVQAPRHQSHSARAITTGTTSHIPSPPRIFLNLLLRLTTATLRSSAYVALIRIFSTTCPIIFPRLAGIFRDQDGGRSQHRRPLTSFEGIWR